KARNLEVVTSARTRVRDGRVFLCRHPNSGSPHAVFLPTDGTPRLHEAARYYWETLPPEALASRIATDRASGRKTFNTVTVRTGDGGSLDATLFCRQDGRKWGLVVRDYR